MLEDFSQELKEKSGDKVPVMLKLKIDQRQILLNKVESLFFSSKMYRLHIYCQSHFH